MRPSPGRPWTAALWGDNEEGCVQGPASFQAQGPKREVGGSPWLPAGSCCAVTPTSGPLSLQCPLPATPPLHCHPAAAHRIQVSSGSPDLPAAPETQSPLSPDTGIICLPCRRAPRGQCCVLASLSDRGREARALGLDSRWGAEKQACPSCRPELATGTLSQDATPCPSPALSAFTAVVVPVPPAHLSLSPQGQEEGGIVSPTGISSWPGLDDHQSKGHK